MGSRHTPEADVQRAIVAWLRVVLPPGSLVHHSAHEVGGGSRWAAQRQAIAQGMGVHAGFPDLVVFSAGRVLFLEVKAPRGRLSPAQRDTADQLRDQGFSHAVVTSVDAVRAVLAAEGFATREARV